MGRRHALAATFFGFWAKKEAKVSSATALSIYRQLLISSTYFKKSVLCIELQAHTTNTHCYPSIHRSISLPVYGFFRLFAAEYYEEKPTLQWKSFYKTWNIFVIIALLLCVPDPISGARGKQQQQKKPTLCWRQKGFRFTPSPNSILLSDFWVTPFLSPLLASISLLSHEDLDLSENSLKPLNPHLRKIHAISISAGSWALKNQGLPYTDL